MWFQMYPNQFTGLLNNDPRSGVGYWKNPVSGLDPFVTDVFFEPIRYFLGQESNLGFLAAFGVSDYNLPVFDIVWSEFQDLADTHAAPCHKFEHQAVSWISSSENDLIDDILFQDLELGWFAGFEQFTKGGIITWVLEIRIDRIFDEIEKGSQKGESQFLCALLGSI
jgi:hypothetical protein